VSAKRALTRVRAPDEAGAEDRAWAVVRASYQERAPSPQRTSHRRLALVLVLAVSTGAVALSPAGATVGRLITRALGVQHAAPALFSLPAPGRLLVSGPGGTWIVAADGSTRRLGPWQQASWSPRGIYVSVARGDQLEAVDQRGTPQWTLARPDISDPRWYPPSGYRVAYLSGNVLRVVAGDGTGDHPLASGVAKVAPDWRPGHAYQLAYLTRRGRLVERDADTGRTLWSTAPGVTAREIAWSRDGQRLLVVSPAAVRVYAAKGKRVLTMALPRGAPAIDGALSPDGHTLALVVGGRSSDVVVANLDLPNPTPRRVLAGAGLRQLAWSPDGKWLVVSWPAADQWAFVRVAGAPRIAAVSRITQQFSAGGRRQGFPQLDGWCCAAEGSTG
jgi:hypothetical protein